MAQKLNVSFQAVSKWENGLSYPDVLLLPDLALALDSDVNSLLGLVFIYEDEYKKEGYYWGIKPSYLCFRVLEMIPPIRPLRLLDIGCGEGKDSVFFAKTDTVTSFDIADAGIEKAKKLADANRVGINMENPYFR